MLAARADDDVDVGLALGATAFLARLPAAGRTRTFDHTICFAAAGFHAAGLDHLVNLLGVLFCVGMTAALHFCRSGPRQWRSALSSKTQHGSRYASSSLPRTTAALAATYMWIAELLGILRLGVVLCVGADIAASLARGSAAIGVSFLAFDCTAALVCTAGNRT